MVGGDGEDSGVSTLLSGARGGPLPGNPGPSTPQAEGQSWAGGGGSAAFTDVGDLGSGGKDRGQWIWLGPPDPRPGFV